MVFVNSLTPAVTFNANFNAANATVAGLLPPDDGAYGNRPANGAGVVGSPYWNFSRQQQFWNDAPLPGQPGDWAPRLVGNQQDSWSPLEASLNQRQNQARYTGPSSYGQIVTRTPGFPTMVTTLYSDTQQNDNDNNQDWRNTSPNNQKNGFNQPWRGQWPGQQGAMNALGHWGGLAGGLGNGLSVNGNSGWNGSSNRQQERGFNRQENPFARPFSRQEWWQQAPSNPNGQTAWGNPFATPVQYAPNFTELDTYGSTTPSWIGDSTGSRANYSAEEFNWNSLA